jgi:hypothetical protein
MSPSQVDVKPFFSELPSFGSISIYNVSLLFFYTKYYVHIPPSEGLGPREFASHLISSIGHSSQAGICLGLALF